MPLPLPLASMLGGIISCLSILYLRCDAPPPRDGGGGELVTLSILYLRCHVIRFYAEHAPCLNFQFSI